LEPGTPLPPPSFLKRKIIIKNKKKHHHHHHNKQKPVKKLSKSQIPENGESPPVLTKEDSKEIVEVEEVTLGLSKHTLLCLLKFMVEKNSKHTRNSIRIHEF